MPKSALRSNCETALWPARCLLKVLYCIVKPFHCTGDCGCYLYDDELDRYLECAGCFCFPCCWYPCCKDWRVLDLETAQMRLEGQRIVMKRIMPAACCDTGGFVWAAEDGTEVRFFAPRGKFNATKGIAIPEKWGKRSKIHGAHDVNFTVKSVHQDGQGFSLVLLVPKRKESGYLPPGAETGPQQQEKAASSGAGANAGANAGAESPSLQDEVKSLQDALQAGTKLRHVRDENHDQEEEEEEEVNLFIDATGNGHMPWREIFTFLYCIPCNLCLCLCHGEGDDFNPIGCNYEEGEFACPVVLEVKSSTMAVLKAEVIGDRV